MEKHTDQQRPLYHNFIAFKKGFDRVWHEGLWHTMLTYDIRLRRDIRAIYGYK